MTDNSYTAFHKRSDLAIEQMLGRYIRKVRLEQNKTQEEVAQAANISRSTLSLLERGDAGNLKTLIQVLRVLDKLAVLQVFEYKESLSPLQLAKAQHKPKQRVKHSQREKGSGQQKKSNW